MVRINNSILILAMFIGGLQIPIVSKIALVFGFSVYVISRKRVRIYYIFSLVLIFVLGFLITSFRYFDSTFSFEFLLLTLLPYLAGSNINIREDKQYDDIAVKGIFYFYTGLFIFSLLGYLSGSNIGISSARWIGNVWNEENVIAASVIGAFLEFWLLVSPVILYASYRKYLDVSRKLLTINVIIYFASILIIVNLQARMGIILGGIYLLIYYLLSLRLNRKKEIVVTIGLMSLSFIILIALSTNSGTFAYDMVELYGGRFREYGIGSERFLMWAHGIEALKENPFSGNVNYTTEVYNHSSSYLHNAFLDIGRYGGIIPMFIFIAIVLTHLRYVVVIIRSKLCNKFRSHLLIALTIYYLVVINMEPIFEMSLTYWAIYFFYLGYLRRLYEIRKLGHFSGTREIELKK